MGDSQCVFALYTYVYRYTLCDFLRITFFSVVWSCLSACVSRARVGSDDYVYIDNSSGCGTWIRMNLVHTHTYVSGERAESK